jgi:hypothetical protein
LAARLFIGIGPFYEVEGKAACIELSFIESLQIILNFFESNLILFVPGIGMKALFLFYVDQVLY